MRAVLAAVAAAFIVAVAASAQQATDPPGIVCPPSQNQWRREGAGMTLDQARAFLVRVPRACVGTRAAVQARIDSLSRSTTAPPDPCGPATAAWAYLRRSSDRAALQAFIDDTDAQCSVRGEAQARLNSLRETPARPPTTTTRPDNPCDAADRTWATLRNSTDVARLEAFVRDTPASCNARGQANARLNELLQQASAPTWRAGQEFDDCSGAGWCPRMVVIPAGSFTMGSPDSESGRQSDEGPQRRVNIRQFAVGKFEVTFDQWSACVNRGGCTGNASPSDQSWGRGTRPVINVSWNDAREYAQWLSGETRHSYRLLTEAEWEYAARAGTTTAYSTGAAVSTNQANFNNALGRTQTVGAYAANGFGLHDMHGNVWEWVQDCYAQSYSGLLTDGSASEISCSGRVFRGGSWNYSPQYLRSAVRNRYSPANRDGILGFRVARTLN